MKDFYEILKSLCAKYVYHTYQNACMKVDCCDKTKYGLNHVNKITMQCFGIMILFTQAVNELDRILVQLIKINTKISR